MDAKENDWVDGWTLGKYEQLNRSPDVITDVNEWSDGFIVGTVEACKYHQRVQHLEHCLSQYPEFYARALPLIK